MSAEEQEAAILKDSGFERCTFGPDEDECEGCDISGLQLYYRRTCYENDEGEYKCLCCIAVRKAEDEAFGRFIEYEENAKSLFRLVLPHVPPTAVDGHKARTHRVSECYLNDAVREFVGDDLASNAGITGRANKETI